MKFSKNYEKLGWTIFTTIRKNTGRYKLGNTYTINTPNSGNFKAKVIGLYPMEKKEITDDLAYIDAEEETKEGLIRILDDWYGKDFDDFILITLWAN